MSSRFRDLIMMSRQLEYFRILFQFQRPLLTKFKKNPTDVTMYFIIQASKGLK